MRAPRQDELGVARAAAEWFTTLEEGRAADRAAFAEWIARSPLHVQEFLNVSAVHRLFENVDRERRIDVGAVMRGPLAPAPLPRGERGRRRWIGGIAAATAAITLAAAWHFLLPQGRSYATAIGEQRTVELDDGSLVYLNAASNIEVHFNDKAREIRLAQGEALFTVEQDSRHPFRVYAGDAVIQALGTQFNVRRSTHDTRVSVIEGSVALTDSMGRQATLAAGEGARLGGDGLLVSRDTVDATRVTAWRQRRLVFESDSLEDIATEFNRYNRAPKIRIEGAGVGRRQFTGVLDADNPESLLRILTEADDLTFEKRGETLVIRPRN